tara:strand:- start:818 stop:1123 length:306 start_codon:yes stop_codon:yes gene_type:complete
MKFVVVFTYMDGEEFEVQVPPNDMTKFIESLGKAEVFFNNESGLGIWIPIDKIRHFKVERVDASGKRIVVSNKELQMPDVATEEAEREPGTPGSDSVETAV